MNGIKRNMDLKLIREYFDDTTTIGRLFVDGKEECYILEDAVRDEKIPHITAIPYGRYEVQITYSPKFGRYLPLLLNVPNFSGIRIHTGNTSIDTDGCLITGSQKGDDSVIASRAAFDKLYPKIVYALHNEGKVFITITK